METQSSLNYNRVASAIAYLQHHFKEQPHLDEVAAEIHLSPAHFQRLFTEWAGTSPKKFLQYISIEHAKKLLAENRDLTLFDTAYETGLSSTSRLHDLFINIEGMSPAEYKNGGQNLSINYRFADSPFGKVIIASTTKGICYIAFESNEAKAYHDLQARFPNALFNQYADTLQESALIIFRNDWSTLSEIKLHLKGTDFQLKVWESLLKIPMGKLVTYGDVAQQIGNAKASRAVGTAIGSNPVAFLIPCHRVIQASGITGGYMWGPTRKTAIIGWESAQLNQEE
ncbi:methylated-DNA--[protein]-cysteine S-methyltransferase [Sphingobacterium faecium]|uniref:methylated-DNA--[protein]-cysteine S-methyltransferase n=1 Tax=Sphingobacterium faecium TaxID=34087 RepID=UPI0024685D8A|nr:methylated-DNA--[protein]-cysteine S-methyltransferase [Sphingobacterium faecium]MDH5826130.1 methylated-DNA--[protein]-cysteine S-methyltransferase [Sphingobacterium faecium]